MKKVKIQEIDGIDLIYCQIESVEEKPADIPAGLFFFWEYGDKKILSPGDIVAMVQKSILSDRSALKRLVSQESINAHYKALHDNQMSLVDQSYDKMIEMTAKHPEAPPELIKHLQDQKKAAKVGFPGVDGTFMPSEQQANEMIGNEAIRKYYNQDEIARIFPRGKR